MPHNKNTLSYISLALLSVINMIVMHYSIYKYAEVPFDFTSYVDNITGVIFDLLVIIVCFLIIFKGKINKCLISCYFTSLLWAFSNILYSRFFFQYISSSAIGQTGNLFNSFMLKCIIEGLQSTDLLFLISISTAIWFYRRSKTEKKRVKTYVKYFFFTLCLICCLCIMATLAHSISSPRTRSFGYIKHHLYTHHIDLYRNSANPNWTYFQRGSIRTIFQPMIHEIIFSHEITTKQLALIKKEILDQKNRVTPLDRVCVENVIFIIVESYLSVTSDLFINGKEITPNLNRLKHSDNVYYNGSVKSNITIGESGDGQFICMTGLLPLRSEITVGRAKKGTLPGLPKILAQHMHLDTRMLIPTTPSMWEQESMCNQYGISKLYSSNNFNKGKGDLNDEQIFQHLQELDMQSHRPFFSVVLTMSMHQPYSNLTDSAFILTDSKLPNEYINYLNACHYTDRHLGNYLLFLKESGIYDKSLIIITADHNPNPNSLGTEKISKDIPLYILNANINNQTYSGPCQQIDIYTTILDLLIKDDLPWRGLGNTLLSKTFNNSIPNTKWDISEWILLGNYFEELLRSE